MKSMDILITLISCILGFSIGAWAFSLHPHLYGSLVMGAVSMALSLLWSSFTRGN